MSVWALSDLHLSFSAANKSMEVFGPLWKNYAAKIESAWKDCVDQADLVLIPGDISWAMQLEEALIDLNWIDQLPGTKLILKGNHDYWWPSSSKLSKALPPSLHFIYNSAFHWKDVTIGGTRLWDTEEYSFEPFIEFQENPYATKKSPEDYLKEKEENKKIFNRELERLRLSLQQLKKEAKTRIALTHYPPLGADLAPSRTSQILEEYQIDICVFGHLHNVKPGSLPFGKARGIRYIFASCDYVNFTPVKIL